MTSDFVTTCEKYFRERRIYPLSVLGLPCDVRPTKEGLIAAYKAKALQHHPDRPGGNHEQFSILSTCYKYLWETLQRLDVPQAQANDQEKNMCLSREQPYTKPSRGVMNAIKSAEPGTFNKIVDIDGYAKVGGGGELQKWEDLQPADSLPDTFVPGRTECVMLTRIGDKLVFRSSVLTEDWNPAIRRGPTASRTAREMGTGVITSADVTAYARPQFQPVNLGSPQEQEWRYAARVREENEREEQLMALWSATHNID